MNITKQLSINGVPFKLSAEDIRLSLFTPGRASFTLQSRAEVSGIVAFHIGYSVDQLVPYFIGYVENSVAINADQQRIYCREFTGTLNRRVIVGIHAATLRDVLQTISADSGLEFVLPPQPYSKTPAPSFYTVGNGYHAMDNIGDVFKIDRYIWQQQGDGKIYVGSWNHSYWAERGLEIPPEWKSAFGVANRTTIPTLPRLRPGALINGAYLTELKLENNQMAITWDKDPWAARSWARK